MASEEMMAAFVADGASKPARAKLPKEWRAEKRKRKAVRTQSNKQAVRTAFLHGILAAKLAGQARTFGVYYCVTCLIKFDTIEEAWDALTPSHIEPRNDSSSRYEVRREPDFRGDDPDNVIPECAGCNGKREPGPEWSAS